MEESFNMTIKKRCIYCHKVLRDDGTCSNEKCVRYTPIENDNEVAISDK